MASRISHTTFDCRDAFALSTFWKQVLAFFDVAEDPNEPGDEECMIIGPGGEPRLLFIEVPEGKQGKNRVHLDLEPTDRHRDDEIQRVQALGATPLHDLRREDGSGWLVLADPEGNEFCILRGRAESEQGLEQIPSSGSVHQSVGGAAPANEIIVDLARRIEAGELEASPDNLDLILKQFTLEQTVGPLSKAEWGSRSKSSQRSGASA